MNAMHAMNAMHVMDAMDVMDGRRRGERAGA